MNADEGNVALYRGLADMITNHLPLDVCVVRIEGNWQFLSCGTDPIRRGKGHHLPHR